MLEYSIPCIGRQAFLHGNPFTFHTKFLTIWEQRHEAWSQCCFITMSYYVRVSEWLSLQDSEPAVVVLASLACRPEFCWLYLRNQSCKPYKKKNWDASVECSQDGTCPCTCNYAKDSSCTCRDLQQAVNVRLAKSPVYNTYPLTYAQSFNFRPTEVCTVFPNLHQMFWRWGPGVQYPFCDLFESWTWRKNLCFHCSQSHYTQLAVSETNSGREKIYHFVFVSFYTMHLLGWKNLHHWSYAGQDHTHQLTRIKVYST